MGGIMTDYGRRRSAADAVRHFAAYGPSRTMPEWRCRLHETVTGVDDHPDPGETLSALAGLTEPGPGRTCRMVDNGAEPCCPECDCRHPYDDEPKFCMGCGARVVE